MAHALQTCNSCDPMPRCRGWPSGLSGRRIEESNVATLHIEHAITDLPTWLGAFTEFDEARKNAGVRSQRIHQPVDDDHYIYVELDFDDLEAATQFKGFLETFVWASPEASPGLSGTPTARVLTPVATGP
jgi:hypothetical protein